jgi:Tol biopolymer transport system component
MIELSTSGSDAAGNLTQDLLTATVCHTGPGADNYDILWAKRATANAAFSMPVLVPGINMTGVRDASPNISADGQALYFDSHRSGNIDLYVGKIGSSGDFDPPTQIVELNTTNFTEEDPWISPDQRTILFATNRDGVRQIYMATR